MGGKLEVWRCSMGEKKPTSTSLPHSDRTMMAVWQCRELCVSSGVRGGCAPVESFAGPGILL